MEPSLVRPTQKVLCSEGISAERQHNEIRHFDRKWVGLVLCRRKMNTVDDLICQLSVIRPRQELRLIPGGASPPQNPHDRAIQLSHVLDRGRRRQQIQRQGLPTRLGVERDGRRPELLLRLLSSQTQRIALEPTEVVRRRPKVTTTWRAGSPCKSTPA